MSEQCPTCNAPVRVTGTTTLHYAPAPDVLIAELRVVLQEAVDHHTLELGASEGCNCVDSDGEGTPCDWIGMAQRLLAVLKEQP